MILSDRDILHRIEQGDMVEPFNPGLLQPASVDLRLGNEFRVFERSGEAIVDLADPVDITKLVRVEDSEYFTLHPGEFVLGHTYEKIRLPDDLVARVEGKSSLGRLGLFVHITAGYVDPGFHGRITLEMHCVHPLAIRLRPMCAIAQVSFHQLSSTAINVYEGRYQGDASVAPSRYGQDV